MPVLRRDDVRAWFRWIEQSSTSLLARINAPEAEVFQAFDAVDRKDSDAAFDETLRSIREETPVRVLHPLVGEEEYQRLIGPLADWSASAGPPPAA
jgi:hypothetical protein